MHPADVQIYVNDCVEEVGTQIERRPDLKVQSVDLVNNVDLYVHFTKTRWGLAGISRKYRDPFTRQETQLQELTLDLGQRQVLNLALKFNLENFDYDPPTAELVDAQRNPLPANAWPKTLGRQGIVAEHPQFARPFFCRRGLREYHTHFQHEDDPWDLHREGLALHTIVIELLDDLRGRWTL